MAVYDLTRGNLLPFKGTAKEILMKFESQLLKGIAPVVVLEILAGGQMYGYELSQAIEQRSGDILTLGKGTL